MPTWPFIYRKETNGKRHQKKINKGKLNPAIHNTCPQATRYLSHSLSLGKKMKQNQKIQIPFWNGTDHFRALGFRSQLRLPFEFAAANVYPESSRWCSSTWAPNSHVEIRIELQAVGISWHKSLWNKAADQRYLAQKTEALPVFLSNT